MEAALEVRDREPAVLQLGRDLRIAEPRRFSVQAPVTSLKVPSKLRSAAVSISPAAADGRAPTVVSAERPWRNLSKSSVSVLSPR